MLQIAGWFILGVSGLPIAAADGFTATGRTTLGVGDNVTAWSVGTTGQLLHVLRGTASSPDTTQNPVVKVSRTMQMSSTGVAPSDGGDQAAGILSVVTGTASNEVQTVGVAGFAKNVSTSVATSGAGDACGIYGIGAVSGSGTGVGIGAYFQGRRETATGSLTGVEIQAGNYSGSAGSYSSLGFSGTTGLWLNANGDADSGVGIAISNPFGYQFKVGIGFTAQVAGAKTGGVADSSIRDDSQSTVSIDIRGTHSGGAIVIASGSGSVNIGTSHVAGRLLGIGGAISGATETLGVLSAGTIQSGVTASHSCFSSFGQTAAASFTLTQLRHFIATQGTIGASSTVTNQFGFIADSSLTGATNNYGFYGNIAAASGRFNFYANGTAANKFTGVTGIGIDPSSTAALTLSAGTTGVASLRIPHGAAPTSPVDGDMWTDTSGLFVRINGATVGPLS